MQRVASKRQALSS